MPNRNKVDVVITECWVTWKQVSPGVYAALCFSPVVTYPVGTIYFQIFGKNQGGISQAIILDSFVTLWARRQGVRTLLNAHLFGHWEVDQIASALGSKQGGEAFMRAAGYEVEPKTGVWFLNRPKKEETR